MKITAIITAAGKGTRAGLDKNKVLAPMPDGASVLYHSVIPFEKNKQVTEIVITATKEDREQIQQIVCAMKTPIKIAEGGSTRTLSVLSALHECTGDIVLIHDGARPFISEELVEECINGVLKYGSAIAVTPCTDTLGIIEGENTLSKTTRSNLVSVQTPQCFFKDEIIEAYSHIKQGETFTDDAGVYCKYIRPAHTVEGSSKNVKLTYKEDFDRLNDIRVGTGFDLHVLVEGRKLILGGVEIEHTKGLLGHSDADVLTHAVMDALLSSVAMRDIGYHFSDKDPAYKDINSMILLERVIAMLKNLGYKPKNLSAVIMAEKPKLSPYVPLITKSLSTALGIEEKDVGITCTTLEGIGTVGREEGIAVTAYCSVEKII